MFKRQFPTAPFPLTINSGAITVNPFHDHYKVDTEGAAASDTLATIVGGYEGQTIEISTAADGRDVVVQHDATGAVANGIRCQADFTLEDTDDRAVFTLKNGHWERDYVSFNAAGSGGPLLFADGTAAAPGAAFADDVDVGLYRPGANILGIATNGTAAERITTAQHLLEAALAGTAALPGYSFVADPNTGIYSIGADQLGIAAGGAVAAGFTSALMQLYHKLFLKGTVLQTFTGNGTIVPTTDSNIVRVDAGGTARTGTILEAASQTNQLILGHNFGDEPIDFDATPATSKVIDSDTCGRWLPHTTIVGFYCTVTGRWSIKGLVSNVADAIATGNLAMSLYTPAASIDGTGGVIATLGAGLYDGQLKYITVADIGGGVSLDISMETNGYVHAVPYVMAATGDKLLLRWDAANTTWQWVWWNFGTDALVATGDINLFTPRSTMNGAAGAMVASIANPAFTGQKKMLVVIGTNPTNITIDFDTAAEWKGTDVGTYTPQAAGDYIEVTGRNGVWHVTDYGNIAGIQAVTADATINPLVSQMTVDASGAAADITLTLNDGTFVGEEHDIYMTAVHATWRVIIDPAGATEFIVYGGTAATITIGNDTEEHVRCVWNGVSWDVTSLGVLYDNQDAAAPTANALTGVTAVNAAANNVALTLPDGVYANQKKFIICVAIGGGFTATVASASGIYHEGANLSPWTFRQANNLIVVSWNGNAWMAEFIGENTMAVTPTALAVDPWAARNEINATAGAVAATLEDGVHPRQRTRIVHSAGANTVTVTPATPFLFGDTHLAVLDLTPVDSYLEVEWDYTQWCVVDYYAGRRVEYPRDLGTGGLVQLNGSFVAGVEPWYELEGTNAADAGCVFEANYGGLRFTTAGAAADQEGFQAHNVVGALEVSPLDQDTITTDQLLDLEVEIHPYAAAFQDMKVWCGLFSGGPAAPFDPTTAADQTMFYFSDAASANWRACTSYGATKDNADTGVAVVNDTTYWLRIVVDRARVPRYYINGALVATGAALDAGTQLSLHVGVESTAAAAKTIAVHRCNLSRIM